MQNGGLFGDPAGVGFFTKPPNFGVEAHIEVLAGVALSMKQLLINLCTKDLEFIKL
jgi:hypothetical protein